MTTNRVNIDYRKNIKEYLSELGCLVRQAVSEDDLSEIYDVEMARDKSSLLVECPEYKFSIMFEEKNSKEFSDFIGKLYSANSSNIYLWTPRTNHCGLFKVDSIKSINFEFPFNINNEGILVFLTTDYADKMLFDFYIDSNDRKILEVEIQGNNWNRNIWGQGESPPV